MICRRATDDWQVLLCSEETGTVSEVRYGRKALTHGPGETWCLSRLSGELEIIFKEGKTNVLPLFKEGTPLIFKFHKNWTGDGRRVKNVTKGRFIVIAPAEWTRTGDVPVMPEDCSDPNFLAHFFYREQEIDDPGAFEEYTVTATPGIELQGNRVFDNSEQGELFGGCVPVLMPLSDVVSARIGEENPDGWRGENFDPAQQTLEQVLADRQGWFYLRVYDRQANRLDSCDFRYCSELQEIRVNGTPYTEDNLLVPSKHGHAPARVEFSGNGSTLLHPELRGKHPHATVRPDSVIKVAPHPDGDRVSCTLAAGNSRVEVTIALPRVWWKIDARQERNEKWRDTPVDMSRETFRNLARAGELFRLHLPKYISGIRVGFDAELDREYYLVKRDCGFEAEIPLRDFADYSQIKQRLSSETQLSVQCGEETLPLVRIAANPAPAAVISNLSAHLSKKRLAPRVKRPRGGSRAGKGFSSGELREAGLGRATAVHFHMPFDHRRRSTHAANINILKGLING